MALLAASLLACRVPARRAVEPPTPAPAYPRELTSGERRWVERTLARLTLTQKAAQLVLVRANGFYQNPRAAEPRALLDQVKRLSVGGLVVFDSEVGTLPRLLDSLQRAADVPLIVALDLERGLSFRVRRGVAPLPFAMAIGATRDEQAARFGGELAAREARAVGVHWAFAPVADVNNNPKNPVINIRSYGEDPELVSRLLTAFIRGARAGGLLTTAKHFPGHGDTAVDSHLALASIAGDRQRMESVELLPFRRAVAAGVDAIMLGHVAAPALDPSGAPATLSAAMATDLLREGLGFRGLIVTDALDMAGVRPAWAGEAALRCVQAGADVVLMPVDPEVAVAALVRGVREGQLSEARLDASVRRLLEVKARLGLPSRRLVDPAGVDEAVGRPEDMARAAEIARASITVVRNEGGVLPLHAEAPLRLLHVVLSSDARNLLIQGFPEAELQARAIPTETRLVGPALSSELADEIVTAARDATHVLVSLFVQVAAHKGTADMLPAHAALLRRLAAAGRPVIAVSYGSPYLLAQAPELPVYVCAYGAAESSQRAATSALFGEFDVRGKLPVTLPGLYAFGHGLEITRRPMTLTAARPAEAGFRPDGFEELDRLLDEAVAARAFPGGVVAVGHRARLAHLRPFGKLSYDAEAPAVQLDTLYDLASLTKVVVTTTMAMILVDEGRLDLDKRVRDFLPRFSGGAKERVSVRHLLTHSSGLDWWAPLHKELQGPAAYVERIQSLDLVYEPGSKSLYSDLGVILLGEILERVAGEPLESFARRRLFEPLGLRSTLFRPGPELRPRIAPTEEDPWRGRLLRGEVHDENAFALGGVAPHAGLFGTALDLARFAQLLLSGGVFEHRRLVSRATLDSFTRRAGIPESSRALGWDTKSENSSAGTLFSDSSFGHTGFTGTSLWIDPERGLFVVLLTNRVHPTRENQAIRQVRPAVADAVVRALAAP